MAYWSDADADTYDRHPDTALGHAEVIMTEALLSIEGKAPPGILRYLWDQLAVAFHGDATLRLREEPAGAWRCGDLTRQAAGRN